jgi:hypothetical protein
LVRVGFLDPKVEITEDVAATWLGASVEFTSCPKLSAHPRPDERLNRLKTYMPS